MKKLTFLLFLALFSSVAFASEDLVKEVVISKIINNTPYDLPRVNIKAFSTTTQPMVFKFPDRPYASAMSSQVYKDNVHQNCLYNVGVNNFHKPYVGGGFAGASNCKVVLVVNQESDTRYNIDIEMV